MLRRSVKYINVASNVSLGDSCVSFSITNKGDATLTDSDGNQLETDDYTVWPNIPGEFYEDNLRIAFAKTGTKNAKIVMIELIPDDQC